MMQYVGRNPGDRTHDGGRRRGDPRQQTAPFSVPARGGGSRVARTRAHSAHTSFDYRTCNRATILGCTVQ